MRLESGVGSHGNDYGFRGEDGGDTGLIAGGGTGLEVSRKETSDPARKKAGTFQGNCQTW